MAAFRSVHGDILGATNVRFSPVSRDREKVSPGNDAAIIGGRDLRVMDQAADGFTSWRCVHIRPARMGGGLIGLGLANSHPW
jgi:hypothetical protein